MIQFFGAHTLPLMVAVAACFSAAALALAPGDEPAPEQSADAKEPWVPGDPQFDETSNHPGARVYRETCAVCHEAGVARAPAQFILRLMPAVAIHRALTTGAMRTQAQGLSEEQKKQVAEYLSGKPLTAKSQLDPPECKGAAARFDVSEPPVFPAWGITATNTRHIDGAVSGLDSGNAGRLRLKWALGFEGATRVRSQPALAGGALYVGSEDGRVYALDRDSGCARWTFPASAEVRTGILVSPWKAGDASAQPLVYFGDLAGNVYAVNARDGSLAWRDRADPHPSTTLTAAPVLHGDRLYVPVSSLEEAAADGTYDCCTFRGSIVAYDARTGDRDWQSFVVDPPQPRGKNANGATHYGPSGVALWNTPAVDAKRGVLLFATGDNYSSPATGESDAVIAMDLATGKIRWVYQALANDAWNTSCTMEDRSNCPDEDGPDYDFGAAVILATAQDGREYVLAGQKSGWVYALDPDRGTLVWKTKVGRGGIMAGVYFGMSVSGDRVFVPISDAPDGRTYEEPGKPGLYALDLHTGKFIWQAPNDATSCEGRGPACDPGIAAAITSTADIVLTGASDGWLRIYDADSGRVLWQYDTMQNVKTIGGGIATGGSMGGGAGPIAHRGTVIVESGYGFAGRMPGNVMLVFEVDSQTRGARRTSASLPALPPAALWR